MKVFLNQTLQAWLPNWAFMEMYEYQNQAVTSAPYFQITLPSETSLTMHILCECSKDSVGLERVFTDLILKKMQTQKSSNEDNYIVRISNNV